MDHRDSSMLFAYKTPVADAQRGEQEHHRPSQMPSLQSKAYKACS